jgi:hypothetical protein
MQGTLSSSFSLRSHCHHLQRENGGSNMPVAIPEPDGEREGIPLWLCPNCSQFKPLEAYGWKKRNDICPGQQVWFKQGWCNPCLEALVKASEVS